MKRFVVVIIVFSFFLSCSGKKALRPENFDPKVWLRNADKLIKSEDFEEARKLLFEVKNRDLTKKYAPIAQLKIAESYEAEEQPDSAVKEYKRFIRLYPDHAQASYAQYKIAMVYYKQIDSPDKGAGGARKALEEFQKLLRKYPRNPYREAVQLRIRKCKNLIADYEMIVGKFYYKKGAYPAAVDRFKGLIENFPGYRGLPEVLYLIGSSYKELGKPGLSRKYLDELVKNYPDSAFAEKAEKVISSLKK
ncbi:outer membrane protein assembly factor BamD precursor [bacterium BMS3Bbin06]|nr:outer membrane protein assembly factor BamD precursor [bacterium BMS3Abin08]GBE34603.1 outer membrane protein assembly factor BamD precursor [bacterium BMS3Bbin06]HDO35685.1 outer membrane protein assembly factor BamD [Nitrospirota bacterium]